MQYAHQHLVVHLDIKPGNILVTDDGTPKLLDFGIARLLDSQTDMAGGDTATLLRPLTPDYASPEQIRGERATVASDIYSLGAVLYELLSGERPRRLGGLTTAEMTRLTAETEPRAPSQAAAGSVADQTAVPARQEIDADLDHIALMALRSDPQRRYVSAAQLAEDIERYLQGLPVIARRGTLAYQSGKFLRRHKTGVAATALICATVIAGLVSTSWQARVAARQRARALVEARLARQQLRDTLKLTHSLLFDYYDSIASLAGSTTVRLRMIQDALEYLNEMEHESGNSAPVQRQIAAAYLRIGDLQGRPYAANLGDTTGALFSYQRALALLVPLAAANPSDAGLQAQIANGYDASGRLLTRMLNYPGASDDLRKAISIRQRLAESNRTDANNLKMLAASWHALGNVLLYAQNPFGALGAFKRSRSIWRRLDLNNAKDPTVQEGLVASDEAVGAVYEDAAQVLHETLGDEEDAGLAWRMALDRYQEGLNAAQRLAAADPNNAKFRRMQADVGVYTARMLARTEDPQKALRTARASVAAFSRLSASDPESRESRLDLLEARFQLALILAQAGNFREAIPLYSSSLAEVAKLLHDDPADREWRIYLRGRYVNFEEVLEKADKAADPIPFAESGLRFDEDSAALYAWRAPWRWPVVADLMSLAKLYGQTGGRREARSLAVRGLALARRDAQRQDASANDMGEYGAALLTCRPKNLRSPAEALRWLRRAVEKSPANIPGWRVWMAQAYLMNGDSRQASAALRGVVARLPWPPEAKQNAAIRRDLAFLAGRNR